MFTMGKGATSSYSRKLKLNTRSLTETELVAADMYTPEMLWTLYFIQSQGYRAECIGLYQDNIKHHHTASDEEWTILKWEENKPH